VADTSFAFNRVILYARHHHSKRTVVSCLKKLIQYFNEIQFPVVLEESTSLRFDLKIASIHENEFCSTGDLLVVVGGDGSLLSASRLASQFNIPIIGINRGQLGFLTDITPNDMLHQLHLILEGQYIEETRHLLRARLYDGKQELLESRALNDVVLSRGNSAYLVEFNVYIDEQFVTHYRADGLILSTPTGSTAYNLSAGGPILHPQLQAFTMVPMFSHSLNARPLVVPNSSQIRVDIGTENLAALTLYLDGQHTYLAHPGQKLIIYSHPQTLRLLHPTNYLYYDTLRIKLGWGSEE
jgi:NAD+ kinase